tara:strand:+ start:1720 stop:2748 length:1029 start_codon:yes stop_codon:yes gene_type:complete
MQRPGFKRGLNRPVSVKSKPIDIKNDRLGMGNFNIQRPGFKASNPIPRIVKFDAFQTFDINNAGVVELGEKTLKRLLEVKIPDEMDKLWLAEKARLTAIYKAQGMSDKDIKNELILNKPLGREQRYNTKLASIGDMKLDFSNRLSELKEEVQIGNTLSQTERATLAAQLANVLNDTSALSKMTPVDIANIVSVLTSIRIPDDRKSFGLVPMFVDKNYYEKHQGAINMLAMNKVRIAGESKEYNYSAPYRDFAVHPATGLPAKSVISMWRKFSKKGATSVLNLDLCALISEKQFLSVVPPNATTSPLISIKGFTTPSGMPPTVPVSKTAAKLPPPPTFILPTP